MCSILKKLGFRLVRQKGSHAFYRHEDERSTVIPMHKGEDLGRGLIRSILKEIEISVAERVGELLDKEWQPQVILSVPVFNYKIAA